MNRHALILGGYAFVIAFIVTAVHQLTKERIDTNQTQYLIAQLAQVLPANSFDNSLYEDTRLIHDADNNKSRRVYIARSNNEPVALVISSTAEDGYVGTIEMLVGIYRDGRIASVRVLNHRETPGLGDGIELRRSNWILQFDELTQSANMRLKKDGGDLDQLTGATVTSRSVVTAVRHTLDFFHAHRQQLFGNTRIDRK